MKDITTVNRFLENRGILLKKKQLEKIIVQNADSSIFLLQDLLYH